MRGLAAGEHLIELFTFKGPITRAQAAEWNYRIGQLKEIFGDNVIGVTIDGDDTPDRYRMKPRGGGEGNR